MGSLAVPVWRCSFGDGRFDNKSVNKT